MRLIDADVLIEVQMYDEEKEEFYTEKMTVEDYICRYSEMPRTVDAVPVKHGKWIPCAKNGLILTEQLRREGISWYGFKCSACNSVRKGNAFREANYCPNCGARMDEE